MYKIRIFGNAYGQKFWKSLGTILAVYVIQGDVYIYRGTGIRGLMRGMATLPQGNQELLVVSDKVGRPQVSLG